MRALERQPRGSSSGGPPAPAAQRAQQAPPAEPATSRSSRGAARRCRAAPGRAAATDEAAPRAVIDPAIQCLKEWAVACAALGAGQQTILLRKGGIREPTFTPKARRFLLFPTSFHSQAQLLKPHAAEAFAEAMRLEPKELQVLPLGVYAELTGAWATNDPEVLARLDPLHVYAPGFLEARLKWRSKEPLTLMELRAYRLAQPLMVQAREEYFGCFSWLNLLPEDAALGGGGWRAAAALGDGEFAERQALLRGQLEALGARELAVP